MREKLSMLLAALLVLQPAWMARAQSAQTAEENSRTAAIRQQLEAAGAGAQVEVKLHKRTLRGELISVGAEDFGLRVGEGESSGVFTIPYQDVKSIKFFQQKPAASNAVQSRSKISRRGKIMLAVGMAALVFGVVTYATTKGP